MPVTPLPAFQDNYIWSIQNKNNFFVVDPGTAKPVIDYANKHNLTLTDILITHHHWDHAGGIQDLIKAFPFITVYAPDDNRISYANVKLKGDEEIKIDGYKFKVLFTPGHTISHICFFEEQKKWLFCGDTLFSAGCGRLFEGTIEQLYDSLTLLSNLPVTTKVFAGHEYTRANLKFAKTIEPDNPILDAHIQYLEKNDQSCSLPSTIALEKEINPFLRTNTSELKQFAKKNNIDPDPVQILKALRKLKDNF